MKRRTQEHGDDTEGRLGALARALAGLDDAEAVSAFLQDLCTPAELEAMTDRWRVVPLLQQGMPYREIHDLTQVSVTTIGRVARTLERGAGGYSLASMPQARAACAKDTP
ncbi:YerC/YecD family TrpR-related protein [Pseudoxanthomonas daejeonensis]|uniref:DNA-binding transcriptional regulator n=1 Tax=Pseudoxanthomonas daejeonensis TaxID=266062 RepID=A0ABQ6Z9K9_9GAMM|nr:YerC/YecD family TrpR-related protein [Pseudoxanthomonas daejeonensis]KAF1696346.1 DNA-binding transcriptional regulator [Pseudoxanthomonas daejeonensis]